jgi:threonyl-tRNA synthetase
MCSQSNHDLENKRHTLAHLMAKAIIDNYPHAKLTLGPAIDTGFYYDVDFSGGPTLGDADLKDIEKAMKKLLNTWTTWSHKEVSVEEARVVFSGNPYKLELIEEITSRGEPITLYTCGVGKSEFTDLCRGGHSENPQEEIASDSFRLERIAGAYWRGSEKNQMLSRIYGLAFLSRADLDAHLLQIEEAKKRDHRLIGEKMDLFHFDETIGKGLPIWLPKGNIIKEALENWAKETEEEWGYDRITTPIITKEDLFYTSGHLPLYKDSMYAPIVIEEENYYIKPMNCPFHHRAFAARPKSYRDLPVRLCEYGWCHRYEDSGSLFGLMRVRGMQMNDAHIYVSREDAVQEFVNVIKLHEYYYRALGINKYEMELALRDPNKMDKYHGDEEDWKEAERMTIEAMEISGVPYTIAHEGAAFYGPKMDFQIESSIGRKFTASTNQLDLYMGKQFNLEYTDKDGQKKIPAIIHRAPLGTHERFVGFLIEHYGGNFPLWLAPEQVKVVPVNEVHVPYATEVTKLLKVQKLRVSLDSDNDSMGKKIRQAKTDKLPYFIVIGDQEVADRTVTLEKRDGTKEVITLEALVEKLVTERDNKVI